MAAREWASLAAGLALAAAGVTALAVSGNDGAGAPPASPPSTVPAVGAPDLPVGTTTTLPAAGDLPAAEAAVLAQGGSLRAIDPAAFGIPEEVARVLASRGVILTVRREPASALLTSGRGQ
jgi:subtilisin family serine protease